MFILRVNNKFDLGSFHYLLAYFWYVLVSFSRYFLHHKQGIDWCCYSDINWLMIYDKPWIPTTFQRDILSEQLTDNVVSPRPGFLWTESVTSDASPKDELAQDEIVPLLKTTILQSLTTYYKAKGTKTVKRTFTASLPLINTEVSPLVNSLDSGSAQDSWEPRSLGKIFMWGANREPHEAYPPTENARSSSHKFYWKPIN